MLLTTTDIFHATSSIADYNCSVRQAMLQHRVLADILAFYFAVLPNIRYNVITMAYVDRWLALSKPFTYSTGIFAKYFWLWTICLVVLLSNLIATLRYLAAEGYCMDNVYGISYSGGVLLNVTYAFPSAAYVCLHVILNGLTLKQLWLLKKKRSTQGPDEQLKKSVKTLLIIVLLYYMCLILSPITVTIIKSTKTDNASKSTLLLLATVPVQLYSCFNFLTYGIINESYRREIKETFKKVSSRCLQLIGPNRRTVIPI